MNPSKRLNLINFFFFIDNNSFIDEKEQCVYDCKLTALETSTIKSKGKSNRDKEIKQGTTNAKYETTQTKS